LLCYHFNWHNGFIFSILVYIFIEMKKYTFLLVTALVISVSTAFVIDDNNLNDFLEKFEKFTAERPQEKLHLHFDKPYYSIGDDIWFKAYLVNAEENKLSLLSKVLYVDLIDERDSVKTFILPIENGLTSGNIKLVDSLFAPGNYQLRAYTKWMENYDPDYFFTKTIAIGDALNGTVAANANFIVQENNDGILLNAGITYKNFTGNPESLKQVNYQLIYKDKILFDGKAKTDANGKVNISYLLKKGYLPQQVVIKTELIKSESNYIFRQFKVESYDDRTDLKFFPEGGNLVNGLRSKVAFKAISSDGLGVDVKGYIEDQQKNKIAELTTEHAGMGLFALKPSSGNEYTAVISLKNGLEKRFKLPTAIEDGYVLSLNHLDDHDILIKIEAKSPINNEVILVAQANGVVIYTTRIKMGKTSILSKLSKNLLAEGIIQVTLFSSDLMPLAERLIFVQPKNKLAHTTIETKEIYAKREKVSVKINVADEKAQGQVGSYSISVINQDKVNPIEDEEITITSNLLLTSDLKGYVEKPNYYFTMIDQQKIRNLDLLMLTQGWRRFKWEDVKEDKKTEFKFLPEKGLKISGTLYTLGNKPIPFGKVNLFVPSMMTLIDTVSDASGRFVFDELNFTDSTKFIVRAKNAKDRNNVKIILDQDKLIPFKNSQKKTADQTSFVNYLAATEKMFNEMNKFGLVNKGTTLKTVEIRQSKSKQPEIYKSEIPPLVRADHTLTPDKLQSAGHLANLLRGLPNVYIKNNVILGHYGKDEGRMLILLNGMPMEDIEGINAMALAGVQIITGGAYAAGVGSSLNGFGVSGNAKFGIVFLTLETRATKYNTFTPTGLSLIKPIGYAITKEFYAPAYDVADKNDKMIDLRSTIYWNPNLITDKEGNVKVSFFTADEPGKYLITLEGISLNGQLTRKTQEFTVR
jgi:hypothetical protein